MNENDFFNRLVIFSFGGHDCGDIGSETIVLIPDNISADDFKNSYNQIVQSIENENDIHRANLQENRKQCAEISNYLKKYQDKNEIKEKAQQKIAKKEAELDVLLKEWVETNKKIVQIDFDKIIQSIGGIILEHKVPVTFTDHNNSSMIVHSMY